MCTRVSITVLPVKKLVCSADCRLPAGCGLYSGGVLQFLYTKEFIQLLCSFSAGIMCSYEKNMLYQRERILVYGNGNVPQTTAESRDISPIHCSQHLQQSVNISIQFHAGLQCDPVQMAKLRQRVEDTWKYLSQDDIRHL